MTEYTPKTDVELENLAQDIVSGQVWSNYNGPDALQSFMVLMLMDKEGAEWMKTNNITFAYEYLSQAGPRSMNGKPTFFSVKFLNQADFEKLHVRVTELARLHKERLAQAGATI